MKLVTTRMSEKNCHHGHKNSARKNLEILDLSKFENQKKNIYFI